MQYLREPTPKKLLKLQSLLSNVKSCLNSNGGGTGAYKVTFSCDCESCEVTIEKTFLLGQLFNILHGNGGDGGIYYELALKYDILFYMVYIDDINMEFIINEMILVNAEMKRECQKQQLLHTNYLNAYTIRGRLEKQYAKITSFNKSNSGNEVKHHPTLPEIDCDAYKRDYEYQKKIVDNMTPKRRAFDVKKNLFISAHAERFRFMFVAKMHVEQLSHYQANAMMCLDVGVDDDDDATLVLYYNRDKKAFLFKVGYNDLYKIRITALNVKYDMNNVEIRAIQASLSITSVVVELCWWVRADYDAILLLKDESDTFIGVRTNFFGNDGIVVSIFMRNHILYANIPSREIIPVLKELQYKLNDSGFCANCHKLNTYKSFKLCGRCHALYYCGKECQGYHWINGGHSKTCKK
jgi:hypothetical protein